MLIAGATPDTSFEILGAENVRLYARQEILDFKAQREAGVAEGEPGIHPEVIWQRYMNCEDIRQDLMMEPEDYDGGIEAAKAVCRGCVVKEECLEYALENPGRFGIWGGTTDDERREIRKQRTLENIAAEIEAANPTHPGDIRATISAEGVQQLDEYLDEQNATTFAPLPDDPEVL